MACASAQAESAECGAFTRACHGSSVGCRPANDLARVCSLFTPCHFATPGNPGVVRLHPWTIMSALQYHLPTLAHDVDRLRRTRCGTPCHRSEQQHVPIRQTRQPRATEAGAASQDRRSGPYSSASAPATAGRRAPKRCLGAVGSACSAPALPRTASASRSARREEYRRHRRPQIRPRSSRSLIVATS